MPIPLQRIRAGVVTDASWGNSKELGTYLEPINQMDWWEETSTTWIRHHGSARTVAFHPASAPGGPDLHDLLPERQTELVLPTSSTTLDDEWTTANSLRTLSTTPWKGKTTFWKQPTGSSLDPKMIHTGYEQLAKLFSQGGEIVMFYDESLPLSQQPQQVSLAAWKSYRLKRRTVNTLSSETQALVRGMGSIHWFRVLILEARGMTLSARDWHREVARLPFICVTDSKSLYDTVRKCTNPASQCEDKRTSIDVALIKQELQDLEGTIRWIDGRTMIADPLTKESKADYLRYVIRHGYWSILEEGAALQQKLMERQGQQVWVPTKGNHRLDAMFIPCQRGHRLPDCEVASKDETPLLEECPTLIWCNPNAAYYEAMVYQSGILKFWLNRGCNLFLFNYAGYGRSSGKPTPNRVSQDGEAVVRFLRSRGVTNLGIYGRSIGGVAACYVARRFPE
eukprot:symbB.v1.2.038620.t1/scaffold6086.1/size21030/1